MSLSNPLFLATFFSIFHGFGGAAIGRGLRTLSNEPENGTQFIFWGILMGVPPIVFDWFFLLRVGETSYGFIGPGVFVLAALITGFFWTEELDLLDQKAIGAVAMGGSALLLGLILTPYLINQALTRDLKVVDWFFGSCFLLFFILIGGGFVWNGIMALIRSTTFDEEMRRKGKKFNQK